MAFRFLFISATLLALASCADSGTKSVPMENGGTSTIRTTAKWIDSVQDIGKVVEGQKVAISFRFKNTGTVPMVIESVQPSCGCTVADFNHKPIAPGAEDEISATFDSEGRPGLQHKQITVKANTSGFGLAHLFFNIEVTPKPEPKGN